MSTASASTASPLPLPPALPAMDSFTSNSSGADSASDPTDLYDPDTDNPLLADDVFAARMSYSAAIHAYTARQWENTRVDIEKASNATSSPVVVAPVVAAR